MMIHMASVWVPFTSARVPLALTVNHSTYALPPFSQKIRRNRLSATHAGLADPSISMVTVSPSRTQAASADVGAPARSSAGSAKTE